MSWSPPAIDDLTPNHHHLLMSSSGSTPSYTPSRVPTPPPDVDSPAYTSTPSRTSTPAATEDDEELARFRRQWREEVLRRSAADGTQQGDSAQAGPSIQRARGNAPRLSESKDDHADGEEDDGVDDDEARPHSPSRTRHLLALAEEQERAQREEAEANVGPDKVSTRPRLPPRQMVGQDAPAHGSAGTVSKMKAAVKAYATAVEMERKGDLDEALYHYRKAFRLDPAADRLYERAFALLRHTDSNDDASASTEKQRDALLASAEVADMVRRATDFDDVRVAAIEKAKAKAAKEQEEAQAQKLKGTKAASKEPPTSPPRRSAPSQVDFQAAAAGTHDELAAIIERAAASSEVEGRDLSTISFTSLPPSVSFKPGGGGQKRQGDVADQLQAVSLDDGDGHAALPDGEELPPPPIAKLPDEILAHICRCVVEPRGRRGARIKPPKVEAPAAAAVTKGHKAPAAPAAAAASSSSAASERPAASADSKPASQSSPVGVGIVLAGPDWQSLEMLARVCWKWRLTTRSRHLWSYIVDETYQEPQLAVPSPTPTMLPNPRETFIHHPRLRLTGCYIAACHYSRQGLSVDNAWVRVVHLVEFYRSIRFLPDGRALTLLTTDVPKETVGRMHAGNGEQGFAVGRWRVEWPLEEEEEEEGYDDGLGHDQQAKRRRARHRDEFRRRQGDARVIIEDLRDRTRHKYSFQMILSLRSTSRGKWNKMEMLDYKSVNLETGEVNSIPNKHSRPFHFSAVRSFGV